MNNVNEHTTMRVSRKLLDELKKKGKMGDSYEKVLWRLLKCCKEEGSR